MICLMWFHFDPCYVGDWPSRSCTKNLTILDDVVKTILPAKRVSLDS